MRKLFLTLIVAVAFSGLALAQESHYPDVSHDFEMPGALVAAVSIDGVMIGPSYDNYDEAGEYYINYNYEVAAFVNDICRGHDFLYYYDGDPYPTTNGLSIGYDNESADMGLIVSFKLYDHINDLEYYLCDVTCHGEPFEVLTGDDNYDGWYNPDDIILLSFSTPTFNIEIDGYGDDVSNKAWYLISSPLAENVAADDVANMTENDYDIYRFNQSADDREWENYKDDENGHQYFEIEPGRGYLYANSNDVSLTFTGWPYEPDEGGYAHVTITNDADHAFSGWNLIGNPFNADVKIVDDRNYYRMNEDHTDLVRDCAINIKPLEGIFVRTDAVEDEITFEIVGNAKTATTQEDVVVNLSRNKGGLLDCAVVRFDDGDDFPKLVLSENNAHVSIPRDGKSFSVVNANKADMIPLNFNADRVGEFMLNVNVENMEIDYLHLIDRVSGDDVDLLLNDSYSFMGAPSDRHDRFELRFSNDCQNNGEIFVYQNGSNIVITGEGTLQVFDVMGRFVNAYDIHGVETIEAMPAGVYVFRVIGESGELIRTQKIVVR